MSAEHHARPKLLSCAVRLEPDIIERLDALAAKHRLSRSWLIREALRKLAAEGPLVDVPEPLGRAAA